MLCNSSKSGLANARPNQRQTNYSKQSERSAQRWTFSRKLKPQQQTIPIECKNENQTILWDRDMCMNNDVVDGNRKNESKIVYLRNYPRNASCITWRNSGNYSGGANSVFATAIVQPYYLDVLFFISYHRMYFSLNIKLIIYLLSCAAKLWWSVYNCILSSECWLIAASAHIRPFDLAKPNQNKSSNNNTNDIPGKVKHFFLSEKNFLRWLTFCAGICVWTRTPICGGNIRESSPSSSSSSTYTQYLFWNDKHI